MLKLFKVCIAFIAFSIPGCALAGSCANPSNPDRYPLDGWIGCAVTLKPALQFQPVAGFALLGTHDSATDAFRQSTIIERSQVLTQNQSISQQLANGVRFLDFRLGVANGRVEMFHGSYQLRLSFEDAINQINVFLDAHPDEFVLLSVKKDQGDDKIFKDWFAANIKAPFFRKLYSDKNKIPRYFSARGKIVILDRGVEALGGIDLNIPDNTLYTTWKSSFVAVQDAYNEEASDDIIYQGRIVKRKLIDEPNGKPGLVKDFYDLCMANNRSYHDKNCSNKYRLNFASFSISSAGQFIGGQNPRTFSQDINPVILHHINDSESVSGILIIDSFDESEMRELARKLIRTNMH